MRHHLGTLGQRVALFAALSVVFAGAFIGAVPANAQSTEVQPSDRSFLVSLRQVNSWLMPVSEEAPSRTTDAAIGNAARDVFEGHSRLDIDLRKSAQELGVVMPNDVSGEHQSLIDEMAERTGDNHDRAYATIVRQAQGGLLVMSVQTRAATQNTTIRTLAHQTVQTLIRTMTVLENTGKVDPSALELATAKAQVNSVRVIGQNVEPSDRELLVSLTRHSLWQKPASRESSDRARDAKVRKVAGQLAAEHTQLTQAVTEAARQIGVDLPSEPTTEQKSWANAISSSSGEELDSAYANLSRAADGSLITQVAHTRATTRSLPARIASQTALTLLLKHMLLLESTGLVKASSLQMGDVPAIAQSKPGGSPSPQPDDSFLSIGVLTGIAVLVVAGAGTLWLVRAVGHHGEHRR
jgi:predicted outer membrane protein